jgi:hypothetical protein
MALPILVAWSEAELVDYELFSGERSTWWGFEFELIEGASGFHAQDRLHGFCGFEADQMPPDGSPVSDDDLPAIISAHETTPEQLEPYVSEIRAAYLAHMRHLGLTLTES